MIREGHDLEPMLCHFLVESRPASVAALETQLPGKRTPEQFSQCVRFPGPHQAQRHQDHGSVVCVRIINIVVLKRPAAWFGMRIIHRPIPTQSHLFRQEPVSRVC